MARCKTFEIARLSFKQLMCQQGQKKYTQYSLALVHNIRAKFTCRRLDTLLAEVWYSSLWKSSSCSGTSFRLTESALWSKLAKCGGVSEVSP